MSTKLEEWGCIQKPSCCSNFFLIHGVAILDLCAVWRRCKCPSVTDGVPTVPLKGPKYLFLHGYNFTGSHRIFHHRPGSFSRLGARTSLLAVPSPLGHSFGFFGRESLTRKPYARYSVYRDRSLRREPRSGTNFDKFPDARDSCLNTLFEDPE